MGARDQLQQLGRDLVVLAARRLKVPLQAQGEPTRWGGYRDTSTSGVAKGLTPAKIASYLQEADDGRPGQLWELLTEIEDRDLHLVGVLSTRKRAVVNLAWDVEPPKNDGRAKARRIAEFCRTRIDEIDNFEDGLIDLLDAVSKGLGVVELEWYNRNGVAGVTHMDYRPQRWFVPDEDDPTEWRLLDQENPVHGVELEPYRFLTHVAKAKSGFPVQAGLGRVLVWWYLFKNYAVKDWVSYAEIFGAPFRIGKYPMGAKPADITALATSLRKLGVDASAVIPEDMKLELITDSRGTAGVDVYERLIVLCERGMSKAVLGQTLTTDEGESGSRALGMVHNEVRQDLVESDARQLARTLKRGLLTPLVHFNFGPDAPVPDFVFDVEPPADEKVVAETQETRAKVFAAARDMGVPVPLAQVREELGLREPQGGEELLPPPVTPATTSAPDPATTPGASVAPPVEARQGRSGTFRVALAQGRLTGLPPFLQQAEGELERILAEGGHADAWRPFVERLQDEMHRLTDIGQVPGRLVELLGEMDLEVLAPQISDTLLQAGLMGEVQERLGDKVLEGFPKVPPREAQAWWLQRDVLTQDQFDTLAREAQAQAFTIARWTSSSALLEAHQLFGRIIGEGGTLSEFEDALEPLLARQGLGPMKPYRLETMFRTNWATAYSVGRDRGQRRPEAVARRPLFRYNNPDDEDSRPEHAAQNGKVYPFDHDFWTIWNPPNGYGCRCWKSAHTREEVGAKRWQVHTELPVDPHTGRPQLPDRGFERDPAREPHEFDWSKFPPVWRDALGVGS